MNTLTTTPRTDWLDFHKPSASARVRLLCLPYAGGGALVFRDWQEHLPSFIEVWPIQLPARGRRIAEPPMRQATAIADAIERELLHNLDTPYAIYGHSMGAVIAFELARRGDRIGKPPVQIFVGARGAPHLNLDRSTCYLSDDQFTAELRRIRATPEEILSDRNLLNFFLPTIRADFEVAQRYQFTEGPRISCPITTFGGRMDAEIPIESLEPWSIHTSSEHTVHLLPGGHFFLKETKQELLSAIATELAKRV